MSQVNSAVFGDYDGETLRLLKAKADREEHELAVARGRFVDLGEVRASWAEIVIVARSRLLALPAAISGQLVGQPWASIQAKLNTEIELALNEIAAAPLAVPAAEMIQANTQTNESHQNKKHQSNSRPNRPSPPSSSAT